MNNLYWFDEKNDFLNIDSISNLLIKDDWLVEYKNMSLSKDKEVISIFNKLSISDKHRVLNNIRNKNSITEEDKEINKVFNEIQIELEKNENLF